MITPNKKAEFSYFKKFQVPLKCNRSRKSRGVYEHITQILHENPMIILNRNAVYAGV